MTAKPTALLVATMDTKGHEAQFISECLMKQGIAVHILDAGIRGESQLPVTVTRQEVARAGGMSIEDVRTIDHEGKALEIMCAGAVKKAISLHDRSEIQGIISLGGSMGTTLGTAVMRSFPVGFPKVMISTMASRDTHAFVGTKDILMLHSVCDLVGLNRVTRQILVNGAMALSGMLRGDLHYFEAIEKEPIFLSSLGTTEASARMIRSELEELGHEVIVFHTVGSGGRAMEEMLAEQKVAGLIDLSLHEVADHMFGGDYDAGSERATTALRIGIPVVLVPGNIDFIAAGPYEKARQQFPDRPYHVHNAAITVVRTSRQEMEQLADRLIDIISLSQGPQAILIPTGGFSTFGTKGGPLHDPEGDAAFYERLFSRQPQNVLIDHLPYDINHPEFAKLVSWRFQKISGLGRVSDPNQ